MNRQNRRWWRVTIYTENAVTWGEFHGNASSAPNALRALFLYLESRDYHPPSMAGYLVTPMVGEGEPDFKFRRVSG